MVAVVENTLPLPPPVLAEIFVQVPVAPDFIAQVRDVRLHHHAVGIDRQHDVRRQRRERHRLALVRHRLVDDGGRPRRRRAARAGRADVAAESIRPGRGRVRVCRSADGAIDFLIHRDAEVMDEAAAGDADRVPPRRMRSAAALGGLPDVSGPCHSEAALGDPGLFQAPQVIARVRIQRRPGMAVRRNLPVERARHEDVRVVDAADAPDGNAERSGRRPGPSWSRRRRW